jgi:hypothetical protein
MAEARILKRNMELLAHSGPDTRGLMVGEG